MATVTFSSNENSGHHSIGSRAVGSSRKLQLSSQPELTPHKPPLKGALQPVLHTLQKPGTVGRRALGDISSNVVSQRFNTPSAKLLSKTPLPAKSVGKLVMVSEVKSNKSKALGGFQVFEDEQTEKFSDVDVSEFVCSRMDNREDLYEKTMRLAASGNTGVDLSCQVSTLLQPIMMDSSKEFSSLFVEDPEIMQELWPADPTDTFHEEPPLAMEFEEFA